MSMVYSTVGENPSTKANHFRIRPGSRISRVTYRMRRDGGAVTVPPSFLF